MLRAHGLRGEAKVAIHTQFPERFAWLEQAYLAWDIDDPAPQPVAVTGHRLHKGHVLLQFAGLNSREDVETVRGQWLLVAAGDAVPLEDGEFYHYQLEDLEVYDHDGEHLGTLVEVMETGANEVFVVRGARGELLIPNTEEVVQEIDLDAGRLTVKVLPGLLP